MISSQLFRSPASCARRGSSGCSAALAHPFHSSALSSASLFSPFFSDFSLFRRRPAPQTVWEEMDELMERVWTLDSQKSKRFSRKRGQDKNQQKYKDTQVEDSQAPAVTSMDTGESSNPNQPQVESRLQAQEPKDQREPKESSEVSNVAEPRGALSLFENFDSLWKDLNQGGVSFDLQAKDKEYEITAALPGFNKENLTIRNHEGVLTISGEVAEEKKTAEGFSRSSHYASRSIRLPEDADEEKITAKFEGGALKVLVPKLTEIPQRKQTIQIE